MRGFHGAYLQISGTAYAALMTNLLLALANLPLLFLLVATDLRATWLPVLALVPLLAISLAAAFSVFERFTTDGTIRVVRGFACAWRAHARRAAIAGGIVSLGALVLSVDIAAVAGRPVGGAAIPLFVVLAALLVATGLHVLAAIVLGVEARSALALWKACLYLAIRRWVLSAASLVALSLLGACIRAMPAWGAGLLAGPLLYLAWANTRRALLPITPTADRLGGAA